MTLRSRLTLAFFAISVVPLAAVTFFSYAASERALRRAAEQQADELAVELGRRMEFVTADLERRMDRAWPPPSQPGAPHGRPAPGPAGRNRPQPPTSPQPTSPEQAAGHVAGVLGDMAPMLESVEFVASPAPPEASRRRRAPPLPAARVGRAPGRRCPSAPQLVPPVITPGAAAELSRAIDAVVKKVRIGTDRGRPGRPGRVDAAAPGADSPGPVAVRPAATAGRRAGGSSAGAPAPSTSQGTRSVTVLRGNALRTELRQDGQQLGVINARINPERLFRAVLGMSRRDRKEIPFAVDADGHLHAPRSSDQSVVESLKLTSQLPASGTAVRSVNDWVVATRKDPSGATFGIARPLGDELRDLRRVSLGNFAVGFGLIALVSSPSIPLAGGMTRNLRTPHGRREAPSAGDLSARVELKSHDEFGRLGAAFNQMAENVAAHQKLVVQQERIRRELELCRLIQNEMLPHHPCAWASPRSRACRFRRARWAATSSTTSSCPTATSRCWSATSRAKAWAPRC